MQKPNLCCFFPPLLVTDKSVARQSANNAWCCFFKVLYNPLSSASFHRSTARWSYLLNIQAWQMERRRNWIVIFGCLLSIIAAWFILENHRCCRLRVNELCFAQLISLLNNYFSDFTHLLTYWVFPHLLAPLLMQFDVLTPQTLVLVLDMS